ncbi:MAG: crossover junction endodeoxyribonuclease RuvC [Candidatus Glassbacteria bacterium]
MKILGIDPGSLATGYGLIETGYARPEVIDCGVIAPDPDKSLPERLLEIYRELITVIKRHSPDELAVENLFYGANVKSLTVIAQVRGVILLASATCGIPVAEYSPREVKMSVVGRGGASKEQVRNMVAATAIMGEELKSLDAADGIAVALCHHGRKVQAI